MSVLRQRRPAAPSNFLPPDDEGPGTRLTKALLTRHKRQAAYSRRHRGQTQSQYLNFGGSAGAPTDGRAEAESKPDSSRAFVG